MKSNVVKRSVVIAGHKTSVSLEDAFWKELKVAARERNMALSDLVSAIDAKREHANLSSAIRLFILDCYQVSVPKETSTQTMSPDMVAVRPARSA